MSEATEYTNGQKLMKATQTVTLDADLHGVEAEVAMRIRALFGRCPELAGFAVQEPAAIEELAVSPDAGDQSDDGPSLYITDVGLSATVTLEEIEKIYALIGTAISDVMSEQPEAFEWLRGRTFARTLH